MQESSEGHHLPEHIPTILPNGSTLRIEVSHLDQSLAASDTEAPVADFSTLRFSTITPAIEGLAGEMVLLLQRIGPSSAAIEFGIEMGVESGQLTAILVKGTGKANLKVMLHWDQVKALKEPTASQS
jgi:Trypsin-co-occurring domain 1